MSKPYLRVGNPKQEETWQELERKVQARAKFVQARGIYVEGRPWLEEDIRRWREAMDEFDREWEKGNVLTR